MKIPSILFLALWFYAFSTQISQNPIDIEAVKKNEDSFQPMPDSVDLERAILIYDNQEGTYYSKDFQRSENPVLSFPTFRAIEHVHALPVLKP